MYYCKDHDSLMLTQDYEDRLVITGLKAGTVLKFAQEIVKKSLEKEVTPKKKTTTSTKQTLSSSPYVGWMRDSHPLPSPYQGGQLNLNSAELIHLIGRFEHEHLRHGSCTMNSKDVIKLKEKLLDEYYIKVQGRRHKA